jgi:hypothetical protein
MNVCIMKGLNAYNHSHATNSNKVHPRPKKRELPLNNFLNLGARWGGCQSQTPVALTPGNKPDTHCTRIPIVQETGWVPGPVWTDAENLVPWAGIDTQTVQAVACFNIDDNIPGHPLKFSISLIKNQYFVTHRYRIKKET